MIERLFTCVSQSAGCDWPMASLIKMAVPTSVSQQIQALTKSAKLSKNNFIYL